ncbi:MAG: NADH-quinone oxidoreductase subunit N [Deltaproteobacteria bacterium]|nr:NADH-quinone oxidoreductase subunit N [Deltaproteobacteria bacterium]
MSVSQSVSWFFPELLLAFGALAVLVVDLLVTKHRKKIAVVIGGLFVLLALLKSESAASEHSGVVALFSGMVVLDPMAFFFKLIFGIAVLVTLFFVYRSAESPEANSGEFVTLLVAVTLGLFLMGAASDMVMMYLSLEFVSLCSYVMAGWSRKDRRSTEAALKYVIYGGVASGVMVYGMSLLYGLTGKTNLFEIRDALAASAPSQLALTLSVVLIIAGIGFKIAAVPFHMWCPDVYEGAPTPVTAFFSVGPKAAGFAMMIRFFYTTFVDATSWGSGTELVAVGGAPWPLLVGIIAAATMTLGNFAAITQNNLKRLLAYSSIAHAGYMLMGIASMSRQGVESVLFYLGVYLFMNLGAFLVVIAIRDHTEGEGIEAYRGLSQRQPFAAVLMTVFLLSLTGVPPFAGFIGKFYLFAAVLAKGGFYYYLLAIIGILNSAVSLFYYARIIRAMFLEEPVVRAPVGLPLPYRVALVALAVPTVVLGIFPPLLSDLTQVSVGALGVVTTGF